MVPRFCCSKEIHWPSENLPLMPTYWILFVIFQKSCRRVYFYYKKSLTLAGLKNRDYSVAYISDWCSLMRVVCCQTTFISCFCSPASCLIPWLCSLALSMSCSIFCQNNHSWFIPFSLRRRCCRRMPCLWVCVVFLYLLVAGQSAESSRSVPVARTHYYRERRNGCRHTEILFRPFDPTITTTKATTTRAALG